MAIGKLKRLEGSLDGIENQLEIVVGINTKQKHQLGNLRREKARQITLRRRAEEEILKLEDKVKNQKSTLRKVNRKLNNCLNSQQEKDREIAGMRGTIAGKILLTETITKELEEVEKKHIRDTEDIKMRNWVLQERATKNLKKYRQANKKIKEIKQTKFLFWFAITVAVTIAAILTIIHLTN